MIQIVMTKNDKYMKNKCKVKVTNIKQRALKVYIYTYVYTLTNVSPDVKLFDIIQIKPNPTVLVIFPNLSKPYIGYSRDT